MSNTTKEEIKVGDYVKILSNGGDLFGKTGLTIGEIRRVECVDKNPHKTYIYVSGIPGSANGRISNCGKYSWCLLPSEVEFVSRDEFFMEKNEHINSCFPETILTWSSKDWPILSDETLESVKELKISNGCDRFYNSFIDKLITNFSDTKILPKTSKKKRKTILEDLFIKNKTHD